MTLDEFEHALSGNKEPQESKILPEAQIATLREYQQRYLENPFRPGDLVRPRKGYGIKWGNQPWIVLESLSDFLPCVAGDGTRFQSQRHNIRVAVIARDKDIYAFWNLACEFEPYTGEGADHA